MDIILELSEGDKRTVNNVDKVVAFALRNPRLIDQLTECLNTADEALAMRAADALQKIHVQKPELIMPYTSQLFRIFLHREQKEIRWHMADIVPSLPLTQKQLDQAATIWKHDFYYSTSSIVRTFSLQAMYDISARSPAFLKDFKKMRVDALENGTPAMKSRAKKLHKLL